MASVAIKIGAVMPLLLLVSMNSPLKAQQSNAAPSPDHVVAQPATPSTNGGLLVQQDIDTKDVQTAGKQNGLSNFPAIVPKNRPVIGLALEGGGALGLAHIGVLQWLDEHHVPIDRIAGTSMGCLIGALASSGHSTAEMSKIASQDNFQAVFTLQAPYDELSFRRKEDRTQMSQAITVGLKHGVAFRNALLTDEGLNNFLLESFGPYLREDLSFDGLPTPLRCVATDLNTLKPVVFRGGSLPEAVRASISIPGVFAPLNYRGHFLADGAIMDNLPTDVVRKELSADVVIAVHLEGSAFQEGDVSSIVGVFSRAYAAGTAQTERSGMGAADHVIRVATQSFSTSDYAKSSELIAAGYKAAEENRAALEGYALSDADWALFQVARTKREFPAPGLLKALKIEGGTPVVQASVKHDLEPLQAQAISPPSLVANLKRVQSDGTYSAVFDTFDDTFDPARATQPSSLHSDNGVRVILHEDPTGPPYLLIGPSLAAMSGNVTQSTFDLRLVDQNFGGYGSELRTDVSVGYLTRFSTEYYRELTPSGVFLQPQLNLIRRPIYIWSNQKRTAEYFEQNAGGGLSFGQTLSPRLQVDAQWHADVTRWDIQTGQQTSQNLSGTAQTALLHIAYDGTQSGTVSPRGIRFEASSGALFHTPSSPLAPLLHVQLSRTTVWHEKNIFGIRASTDTYFRRSVADPFRFTLGGPLRLSASSIDEYRGTDNYLVGAGYLRRILPLPSGLGQGIYTSFAYEAGEIWTPQQSTVLRQDVLGAFVAVTPLGAISLGAAVGDAGRRKVFVTVGRTF
jgi:NTE family protein